jgi:N-acetylmuramic acid 6-phosphate (MurNAc-6-P) etherase
MKKLSLLTTEESNPRSIRLDEMSINEVLTIMNGKRTIGQKKM